MSQLGQLKEQIEALGTSAQRTAGSLQGFNSTFNSHIQQVEATIGGSAQGKDREVISAFDAASRAVDSAVQALQQAAGTARSYGASL